MKHRVTENTEGKKLYHSDVTGQIIASATEVHRHLGPGLLESTYEACLCHELHLRKVPFERQKALSVDYKGVKLNCGYRMDLIVAGKVVVELKCVDRILPIHQAQMLTYLKLSGIKVGLIINFYTEVLKNGLKRLVL